MNQNNSFALHCVHILEPREFAIGRRNNVPLYREIIILNEDQYENAIRNPDEPVRPRGEIRLIGGLIIPGLSYGRRDEIYSICLLPIHLWVY